MGAARITSAEQPQATSQVSMPAKLVEVSGPLEGKILVLEMDQFPRERWPAVERRLQQELRSLGLETETVSSSARERSARVDELRQTAVERRAVGALRILRKGERRRVEIWLHDVLTGKTVHRQVEVEEASAEPSAVSLVSLRAVEVLHSSLLEVRMNEGLRRRAPPAVERFISRVEEAEEMAEEQAAPQRWRAWIGPAVGVDLGDGGVGALPLAQVGLGLRLLPWLSCELEVDIPLPGASIEDHRGAADLLVTRVTGLLSLEPWAQGRWSPSIALGAGLLALNASGNPEDDRYEGASQWATAAWLTLRAALSVKVFAQLRLVGALAMGVAVPGVLVRFEEEAVATVGQPWISGQLGVEWRWSTL